jgi:hypothetical protein
MDPEDGMPVRRPSELADDRPEAHSLDAFVVDGAFPVLGTRRDQGRPYLESTLGNSRLAKHSLDSRSRAAM